MDKITFDQLFNTINQQRNKREPIDLHIGEWCVQ